MWRDTEKTSERRDDERGTIRAEQGKIGGSTLAMPALGKAADEAMRM
jgi:hypothetical protein